MDEDQSTTSETVTDETARSADQVRDDIENTRAELGDTVAALAEKTDVKAQAKQSVSEARESVSGKVSDLKDAATGKRDEFIASAQDAAPDSASDAGSRALALARGNATALIAVGAFGLGMLLGSRRAR
jgi:hypothetical protein